MQPQIPPDFLHAVQFPARGIGQALQRGQLGTSPQSTQTRQRLLPRRLRKRIDCLPARRLSRRRSSSSALIEVGAQTNTYEEAVNAMDPLAQLLDRVLTG